MNAQQIWRLPDSEIRAVFARAAQKYSGDKFVLAFAAAIDAASFEDFKLLRPVAERFIEKYALE